MNTIRKTLICLLAFLLAFGAAVFLQQRAKQTAEGIIDEIVVENKLEKQIDLQHIVMEDIQTGLPENPDWEGVQSLINSRNKQLAANNIDVFLFRDSSLLSWNDRALPVSYSDLPEAGISAGKRSNGWYVFNRMDYGEYVLLSSILIKREYSYENPYLPEYVSSAYDVPDDVNVSLNEGEGIPVSFEDSYLFSFVPEQETYRNSGAYALSVILYFIAFISLLACIFMGYSYIMNRVNQPNWLLLAVLADIVLLRFVIIHFEFPSVWMQMDLFSPVHYAESMINDSLGGLLINTVLWLFFALVIHRFFRLKQRDVPKLMQGIIAFVTGAFSFMLLFYSLDSIKGLILNSSIPFDFNRLLELNYLSYIGLLTSILMLLANGIIIDRILKETRRFVKPFFWQYAGGFFLLTLPVLNWVFSDEPLRIISLTALIAILYVLGWIRIYGKKMSYYALLLLAFLSAVLITSFVNEVLEVKQQKQSRVLAMNLSNERDPGAEYFLKAINNNLCEDNRLINLLEKGDYDKAYNYFFDTYLQGYLEKYDVQLSLCNVQDSLIIQPDNVSVHCQDFFGNMLNQSGIIMPGSDFYFLDNNNGRISYLGKIPVSVTDSLNTNLYVELDSRLQIEGPGYPELLLDKTMMPKKYSGDVSYAKYYKTELIDSKGAYDYAEQATFPEPGGEYYSFIDEGYRHLVYYPGKGNYILVSREEKDLRSYLIFFTYIFFVFIIVMNLVYIIYYFARRQGRDVFSGSMKNRIQTYLVVILSVSIIVIGTVSISFYIRKYKEKQTDAIEEKMQSVLIELNHKIGTEENLDSSMEDYLNYLLVKFSNVFYTDINLFDTDGSLLASSRMELYERGLVGKRMSPKAYDKIARDEEGYFVQNETIGKMDYLSAYLPFRNQDGKVLAYINLPYFAKQQDFRQEISSLTVAVLNVYLALFILTILAAIFTSNQLTRPLRMIEESLRKMDISRRNRKISYSRDDEIGSLVKEYNRKVDELAESAERLARSEREFAWREMAKQIAHEIKNPLTPMKLSVQHLEKAYKENDPDLDYMFDKVSKTLIEQIESLANIATEFSNFAKIRLKKKEPVDLSERIERVEQLFSGLSSTIVEVRDNTQGRAVIMADKEQIMRVFNNLIKNALQAIPDERTGVVRIKLDDMGDYYLLEISDNGSGINQDMHDKIFSPNFTTKTSGMGLGLSIVKGVVDNMDGKIYFETQTGVGTSFFIEFPKSER